MRAAGANRSMDVNANAKGSASADVNASRR